MKLLFEQMIENIFLRRAACSWTNKTIHEPIKTENSKIFFNYCMIKKKRSCAYLNICSFLKTSSWKSLTYATCVFKETAENKLVLAIITRWNQMRVGTKVKWLKDVTFSRFLMTKIYSEPPRTKRLRDLRNKSTLVFTETKFYDTDSRQLQMIEKKFIWTSTEIKLFLAIFSFKAYENSKLK